MKAILCKKKHVSHTKYDKNGFTASIRCPTLLIHRVSPNKKMLSSSEVSVNKAQFRKKRMHGGILTSKKITQATSIRWILTQIARSCGGANAFLSLHISTIPKTDTERESWFCDFPSNLYLSDKLSHLFNCPFLQTLFQIFTMEYDHHFSYYTQNSPRNPQSQEQQKRHQHHLICFTSCFRSPTLDAEAKTSLVRSPSSWIRSKAQEFPDDVRGKCRNLLSRHKRRHSSDFGYDPMSYARNFDNGGETTGNDEEELPYMCFSARLPQSPQSQPPPQLPVQEEVTMPADRIGGAVPLLVKPKPKGKSRLMGLNSV